jgi:hypothetical protein
MLKIRKDITRTFSNHVNFKRPKPRRRADEKVASVPLPAGDREPYESFLSGDNFGEGQIALFHVLKAYAVFNPTVDYAQSMGFTAGVFLMYMQEEDAFWMLDAVLTHNTALGQLGGFFSQGFPLLFEYQYVVHCYTLSLFPGLHAKLIRSTLISRT